MLRPAGKWYYNGWLVVQQGHGEFNRLHLDLGLFVFIDCLQMWLTLLFPIFIKFRFYSTYSRCCHIIIINIYYVHYSRKVTVIKLKQTRVVWQRSGYAAELTREMPSVRLTIVSYWNLAATKEIGVGCIPKFFRVFLQYIVQYVNFPTFIQMFV